MGLDVSAFKNILAVDPSMVLCEEGGYPMDEHERFYKHPSYPEHYDGLVEGTYYSGEHVSGPSMNYGYYNRWRDQLAKLAGYPIGHSDIGYGARETYCASCWAGTKGPFSEQINFSDCEGAIGPSVSLKLSQDYAAFDEQAKTMGEDFYRGYTRFKNVFDAAASTGAVKFG